jgi:hypothetical protein
VAGSQRCQAPSTATVTCAGVEVVFASIRTSSPSTRRCTRPISLSVSPYGAATATRNAEASSAVETARDPLGETAESIVSTVDPARAASSSHARVASGSIRVCGTRITAGGSRSVCTTTSSSNRR